MNAIVTNGRPVGRDVVLEREHGAPAAPYPACAPVSARGQQPRLHVGHEIARARRRGRSAARARTRWRARASRAPSAAGRAGCPRGAELGEARAQAPVALGERGQQRGLARGVHPELDREQQKRALRSSAGWSASARRLASASASPARGSPAPPPGAGRRCRRTARGTARPCCRTSSRRRPSCSRRRRRRRRASSRGSRRRRSAAARRRAARARVCALRSARVRRAVAVMSQVERMIVANRDGIAPGVSGEPPRTAAAVRRRPRRAARPSTRAGRPGRCGRRSRAATRRARAAAGRPSMNGVRSSDSSSAETLTPIWKSAALSCSPPSTPSAIQASIWSMRSGSSSMSSWPASSEARCTPGGELDDDRRQHAHPERA